MIRQAILRPGIYWHVFPTYSEGKDTAWRDPHMLFDILPQNLITKKNDSECIAYLKNGSIYQIKGANEPDRLRGPNPYGVVLDEFDTMKFETWSEIVEPILRINNGWAWFVGTYKGKLKLYEFQQRGLDHSNFKEWKSWELRADRSGIVTKEQLEEARLSMPQTLFNQELLCIPMESEGSVFRNVRAIANAIPQSPNPAHIYVMGVDLAKVQDFTVITVYDRANNSQVYQDRFQTLEWPFQKKRIQAIAKHYNNALIIMDATGIGDPIVDDLLRAGLAIEPIKITNEIKKELIEKLSIWIEQKKMSFIPFKETLLEFDNFSYEVQRNGRVFYQARQGFHDDIVISHALSVYGLQPVIPLAQTDSDNLIRNQYLKGLRNYYGNSSDDPDNLEPID